MSLSHSPSIVTSGLVLCLDAANTRSYPGSGTSWYNLAGTINTGVLTNGPTYGSTNLGSIVFDGVDDYVDMPANMGSMANYTIMFWARRDAESRMPVAGRTSTAYYWYGDNS